MLNFRFDIYGLSPDADEDEAGIKRASESSESEEHDARVRFVTTYSF